MGARVSADDGPGVARRCVLFSPSSPCVLRRMILILVANDLVRASFEFLLYFRSGVRYCFICEYVTNTRYSSTRGALE